MRVEWKYVADVDAAAIRLWMENWHSGHPQAGVLAFVAERSKDAISVLQRCASEAQSPLIGAMFPELIVGDSFKKEGVLLCGMDPLPAHRLLGQLDTEQGRTDAVAALRDLVENDLRDGTLMMFFDGMFGQVATLLDDLFYAVGGLCRYAGVNAGSETFQPMPCLFDGERWIGEAVLALALEGNGGAELEHGYAVPDETLTASAATGNRIVQIEWQPAFKKYSELIHKHYGETVTRDNFYSMGVHFPFALLRADGQLLIRIPVAVDDAGALFCVGEIPDGALLTVAKAVVPGSTHTVEALLERCRARDVDGGMFFYCAGRRMHLGETAATELTQFAKGLPGRSAMGALSLGEIGNSLAGGYPLFHNATLVALPLAMESDSRAN